MTKFKVCSRTLVIVLLTASSAFADGAVAQMTGGVHEKNLQPDNMELHLTGVKQSEDTVDIVGSDGVVGQNGDIGMEERDYVFLFGNVHRDTAVLRVLVQNAPDYFNAPDMPRFAIVGKERKFYLGIGGFVKASVSYDLGDPIENPLSFVTSAIPMDNLPGNSSLVQMSAGASNLFFNFIALPHTKNQIGAYVNFAFSGNGANYGFSLKSAYFTYKGFSLGYKTSLFTDGAASAPTVDQQGPNAMTFVFNTVLNYQYAFNSHWKVGLGLELPVVDATYNATTYVVNQRIPDIPFYVQYSWADGEAWLRLSGLIRNMYYRDKATSATVDEVGYGIKLSSATPLRHNLKLFSQCVYGKGIGSYIQDLQGLGLDMVPVSENGRLEGVTSWASYVGLQWKISPKFSSAIIYSMVESYLPKNSADAVEQNEFMPSTTYKNAKYVVSNLFYNITPSVQAGVEYLWGSRENIDGISRHDTRLQTAVRVNF